MKWVNSKYQGVRFRKHPTRKHGVRFDRYFTIRYQSDGERKEEGLGWESEGITEENAALTLLEYKRNAKLGQGPTRKSEEDQLRKEKKIAEKNLREREEQEWITFSDYFREIYMPQAESEKKTETIRREKSLFKSWIQPTIGNLPLMQVCPFHIEQVKKKMHDKGQSPRSIQYMIAVVRQVFHSARSNNKYEGKAPTSEVKKPKFDNRRMRFLSHDEAQILLSALKKKSVLVHEISLISLTSGLRFNEIVSLVWSDFDLSRGILTIRNTKNGRTRVAYLTSAVREIFSVKVRGRNDELIFQGRDGVKIERISRTFERVVEELGFNKNISDSRQRFVFHSLRHTYASWMVEGGVSLYVLKNLLGHSGISQTERYAHLGDESLQAAVKTFEKSFQAKDQGTFAEKIA